MIQLVNRVSALVPFAQDAFGCRIYAAQQLYPDTTFVQSWVQSGGKLAVGKTDSALTVSHRGGAGRVRQEELNEFLRVIGGESVLMPFGPDSRAARGFSVLGCGRVMQLEREPGSFVEPVETVSAREAFSLMCECFPETGGDAQYVDLSYRVRHGGCRIYGVWQNGVLAACAMTTAETEQSAVIGGVCCREEFRGNGLASRAVSALSRRLCAEGRQAFLFAEEALVPFYLRLGFAVCDSWWQYRI